MGSLYLNYSKDIDTDGANCIDRCEIHFYQDETLKKCLSCETNNTYKSPNNINCVDSIPNGYYLNQEVGFNFISKCGVLCEKCDAPPNIFGNNCLECKHGYYPVSNQFLPQTFDCFTDCGELEVFDLDNLIF